VKHLRLAKVATLKDANAFLESAYWPEWNAHFARPVADFPNQHRVLSPQLDLAAVLCHVEERMIGNDYTFSFAGRRLSDRAWRGTGGYAPPARARGTPPRRGTEGALSGQLRGDRRVRHAANRCAAKESKPVRKDHNAGGRSSWMQGFFDRPSPPLWKSIGD